MSIVNRDEFEPVRDELSNLTERVNQGKREMTFNKVRLWAGRTPVIHNTGREPVTVDVYPDGNVNWWVYGQDGKRVILESSGSATAKVVMRW